MKRVAIAALAMLGAACSSREAVGRAPQLAFAAPARAACAPAASRVVARGVTADPPRLERSPLALDVVYAKTHGGPARATLASDAIALGVSGHGRDDYAMVARPDGGYLVFWIDGDVASGFRVEGMEMSSRGVATSAPFVVSEMHAATRVLRAAIVESGRAVVAYHSSREEGLDLVATDVVCEAE